MIISSIVLSEKTYAIDAVATTASNFVSVIYSPYGNYTIRQNISGGQLSGFSVFFLDKLIGRTFISNDQFANSEVEVGSALCAAIDIANKSFQEKNEEYERNILFNLAKSLQEATNLTDAQRAIYRNVLTENGLVDKVKEEQETPTQLLP